MAGALPQDCWYAVGGSRELLPGQARATHLLGQDLACWRGGSGRFHAWRNRCAHRGMRLSFGFVRGDRLTCRYHGWTYDEAGYCSLIPAHPNTRPPKAAVIPGHGAGEQDGLLWVRLGEGDGPPPDLAALAPQGSGFQFSQSLFLPLAPEELAPGLPRLIFLPAALANSGHQAWRYRVEVREETGIALRWIAGNDEDQTDRLWTYRYDNPYPGLFTLRADSDSLPGETRLLALQPLAETRSALHVMAASDSGDVAAAAHWGRRLRWFLENDGRGAAAYNPWVQEQDSA